MRWGQGGGIDRVQWWAGAAGGLPGVSAPAASFAGPSIYACAMLSLTFVHRRRLPVTGSSTPCRTWTHPQGWRRLVPRWTFSRPGRIAQVARGLDRYKPSSERALDAAATSARHQVHVGKPATITPLCLGPRRRGVAAAVRSRRWGCRRLSGPAPRSGRAASARPPRVWPPACQCLRRRFRRGRPRSGVRQAAVVVAAASTFGDHDDGISSPMASRFVMVRHGVDVKGQLGQQDGAGAGGHAGVQRDPAGIAAHHPTTMMRWWLAAVAQAWSGCSRWQSSPRVEAEGGAVRGRCRSSWHAYDAQVALLGQAVGNGQRAVAATATRAVDAQAPRRHRALF